MKMSMISRSILVAATLLLLVSVTSTFSRPIIKPSLGGPRGGGGPDRFPVPTTIDQVTHNKGNIVTTIDNWGYIGGYQFYDRPSGEWPRNSGHDYIGELKYWMGATVPAGDTLVANTYDDFEGMPSMIDGQASYRILLSTDTTRYWGYDLTDTVGAGAGNPANGWRVWNPQTSQWEYNSSFNSLSSSFMQGGPTSLQESHYRFDDKASGALLGLEVTHTILQWNYCYNEDFMFVIMEITNTSANDYADFAFGLYMDIDVGGPDGTGENGRLGDVVAYDTTENLAWTYDVGGYDPGWGGFPNGKTGVMGTKYLETPDNIGMTAFRSGDWAVVSNIDDGGMYDLINSTQFDASLPPTDQYYIQCTRGINLTAGKTVRVVYAIIAGEDVADLKANAAAAQTLYDNFYVGPQPPATPVLHARSADQKIYLDWTNISEVGVDPLTQVNDFGGYKLYRSENQGKTWGKVDNNNSNSCLAIDYDRIAEFNVTNPGDPIARSYIDTGLFNGVEYWYCLAAYDVPDTSSGVDALQSGFGIAGEVPNVVKVIPFSNPAGYFDAAGTVVHTVTGSGLPSEGTVIPTIFNVDSLLGADYKVVFEDNTSSGTQWHLINITTGDTVLINQTRMGTDPNIFDVVEGLRVVVTNADRISKGMVQTQFSGTDTTLALGTDFGPGIPYVYNNSAYIWGDAPYRNTFELRYTGDSTVTEAINDTVGYSYVIPFEAWNTTTNERVWLSLYDNEDGSGNTDGIWNTGDPIIVVDYPYDPASSVFAEPWPIYFSWMFSFDKTKYNPSVGDVFTVQGAPLFGPGDEFAFKVDGINAATARVSLDDIKVVPNPYFVGYSARIETSAGQSVLEFQQVPGVCTIRIYTMAGDLVRTIEHNDGTGTARWDLQAEGQRLVASGIYLYHVESEFGEHLGRFAVVK